MILGMDVVASRAEYKIILLRFFVHISIITSSECRFSPENVIDVGHQNPIIIMTLRFEDKNWNCTKAKPFKNIGFNGHGTGLNLLNNILGIALKCCFESWCLVVALSQANSLDLTFLILASWSIWRCIGCWFLKMDCSLYHGIVL